MPTVLKKLKPLMSLLQAKPQRQTNLQGSSRGKGLDIPEISLNACHTPGDYSKRRRGPFRLEVQPFYITFLTEKVPLSYTFQRKILVIFSLNVNEKKNKADIYSGHALNFFVYSQPLIRCLYFMIRA